MISFLRKSTVPMKSLIFALFLAKGEAVPYALFIFELQDLQETDDDLS